MSWCEMFSKQPLGQSKQATQVLSHPESSNPPQTNSQIVDWIQWEGLRLVRSTRINWIKPDQLVQLPSPDSTATRKSTAAAGCWEPGIELANSIHGSGWFYSGYSGFHLIFLKREKKRVKKIKRKDWKEFKNNKATENTNFFFRVH